MRADPAPIRPVGDTRPAFDPRRDALFLDLDGTLAPLAPRPWDVKADPGRNRLLADLTERLGGRLAVVSGRTIEDVDRILGGAVATVAGVHGLAVRFADGRSSVAPPHPGLAAARSGFQAFVARRPALLVEDKGVSIALHFRAQPALEEESMALAMHLAEETGLLAQKGAAVIELRTPGANKGDAIAVLLAGPPFAGRRPVFAGDDLTDEDAFAFVEKAGGTGVLVGPPRPTAASRRLPDVAAVLAWLEEIARA